MEYTNQLIQPLPFRYFLTTSSVEDELLEFAPEDWGDSSITIKKDMTNFFANRREFSLPLGFTKRARTLLRDEFLLNGISGKGIVRMEILDNSTWQYELFYQGKIDFAKIDLKASFIEVNFLDSDIQASVKAFESTEFELGFSPITDVSQYDVILPPVEIKEYVNYFAAGQGSVSDQGYSSPGVIYSLSMQDQKNRLGKVIFFEQVRTEISPDGIKETQFNNSFADPSSAGITFGIQMDLRVDVVNMLDFDLSIRAYQLAITEVWKNETTNLIESNQQVIFDFRDWGEGYWYDQPILIQDSYTNIQANSHLFLTIVPSVYEETGNKIMVFKIVEGIISVDYVDQTGTDKTISYPPVIVFRNLMRQMTGITNLNVKSDFLTDSAKELFITCGDAIRRLPREDTKIKTSFRDFWKAISAVYDLGFDIINGIPTIEEKAYFFNPNIQIESLGTIKDLLISPATPLIFNDIKTGYESQDYETEFGRLEINNGQTWKTPISAGKNTLDLVSPYRADPWGINDIREKSIFSPRRNELEADGQEDNDVFFLWVDLTSFQPQWTETIHTPNGPDLLIIHRQSYEAFTLEKAPIVVTEGYYPFLINWAITPKSNLERHKRHLSTAMYGQVNFDKEIKVTKIDKNNILRLARLVEGSPVFFDESAPLQVSELDDPYFVPFEVSLKVAFPFDFYKSYRDNPTGYVSFEYRDFDYKIFITEISFDVVGRSDFEIKGFLLPDQDISGLFY